MPNLPYPSPFVTPGNGPNPRDASRYQVVKHPAAPKRLPYAIKDNATGGYVTGGSPHFPRVFQTKAEAQAFIPRPDSTNGWGVTYARTVHDRNLYSNELARFRQKYPGHADDPNLVARIRMYDGRIAHMNSVSPSGELRANIAAAGGAQNRQPHGPITKAAPAGVNPFAHLFDKEVWVDDPQRLQKAPPSPADTEAFNKYVETGEMSNFANSGIPPPPPPKMVHRPDDDSWGSVPLFYGKSAPIPSDLGLSATVSGMAHYPGAVISYLNGSSDLAARARAFYTKHGVNWQTDDADTQLAEMKAINQKYANDPQLKALAAEQQRMNKRLIALIPFSDVVTQSGTPGGRKEGVWERMGRGGNQFLYDLLSNPVQGALIAEGAVRSVGSLVDGVRMKAAGSSPLKVEPHKGATPGQIKQYKAYAKVGEEGRKAGIISPTGRVSTKGPLSDAASNAAKRERYRAVKEGRPYGKQHAGHVLDTTWTGTPDPYAWMPLDPIVNSTLGAQARQYPIGYLPSGVIYQGPPVPWTWDLTPFFGLGAQAGQNSNSLQTTKSLFGKSRW